jgi:hypothetical protein
MSSGLQTLIGLSTGFGLVSSAESEASLSKTKHFYQIASLQSIQVLIALAHAELFIKIPTSARLLISATPLLVGIGVDYTAQPQGQDAHITFRHKVCHLFQTNLGRLSQATYFISCLALIHTGQRVRGMIGIACLAYGLTKERLPPSVTSRIPRLVAGTVILLNLFCAESWLAKTLPLTIPLIIVGLQRLILSSKLNSAPIQLNLHPLQAFNPGDTHLQSRIINASHYRAKPCEIPPAPADGLHLELQAEVLQLLRDVREEAFDNFFNDFIQAENTTVSDMLRDKYGLPLKNNYPDHSPEAAQFHLFKHAIDFYYSNECATFEIDYKEQLRHINIKECITGASPKITPHKLMLWAQKHKIPEDDLFNNPLALNFLLLNLGIYKLEKSV